MKKLFRAIGILFIVNILVTAVLLILSPDVIPVHYNMAGEADRFGSKYENLIFPGFSILMVGIMLLLLRLQQKKNVPEPEQRVLLYTAVFSQILFLVLEISFWTAAIRYSQEGEAMAPDMVIRFISVATGMLFVALGNLMPKIRRNSFFGLRTKWSMASDSAWQKSQRFGGISGVACGLAIIVAATFVPGVWNIVVLTVVLILWIAACVVASYQYDKNVKKNAE